MKTPILFFGNECLSSATDYHEAPIFKSLIFNQYNIEALIIKNKPTKSRKQRQLAIISLAQQYNIPVIEIAAKEQLEDRIKKFSAKIGIVASFGLMITDAIIHRFPLGLINIHPSLLPKYRGTTPIETAILNGDQKTGVSLIKLNSQLDEGDIYIQQDLESNIQTLTKLQLTQQLGELAAQLVPNCLPNIIAGKQKTTQQNHRQSTYTQPIKAKIFANFKQASASYWTRHIKAFKDCPNNKFIINQTVASILQAEVNNLDHQAEYIYDKQAEKLNIKCSHNYLAINHLKPDNRQSISAREFVNGFWKDIPKL